MMLIHIIEEPYSKVYHDTPSEHCRAGIIDTAYTRGEMPARYPVPAILLAVQWPYHSDGCDIGYLDMIYIDDVTNPDDPVMVCCWDFYRSVEPAWRGVHQHCYIDARVEWYKKHGAW